MHEALGKKGAEKSTTDLMTELDIADRLDATEDALVRERMALERTKVKKNVLENVTKPRTVKELQADVKRKRSDELAKHAKWELEISKTRKLERQIEACDIKAPADGTIVYANDPGRPPQIEEGATVRERQKIFRVIERNAPFRVNAWIRESQVDKLSRNMKARIRVDAFPNETLDGTILRIASRPVPTNFRSPDVKVYMTETKIDHPLPGLRPGMTAQVEIMVSELDNVISVPVAAVVQYNGKDHLAVKKADGGWDCAR